MYLVTGLLLLFGGLFYAFDGHTITKNTVVKKYNQFRQVNKLAEVKYKTCGMILWVSIQMIAKMYWLNFLQWINTSLSHHDKNTLVLSYVYNGKLYKVAVKLKRGPKSILMVTDDTNTDVTEIIQPFSGPKEDWHGTEFTPEFWNYKSLTFHTDMGDEYTFERDEVISLPN